MIIRLCFGEAVAEIHLDKNQYWRSKTFSNKCSEQNLAEISLSHNLEIAPLHASQEVLQIQLADGKFKQIQYSESCSKPIKKFILNEKKPRLMLPPYQQKTSY